MAENANTTQAPKKPGIFKEVVPLAQAQEEIASWLDQKKVAPHEREKNESHIEALVEAVRYGTLVLNESRKIKHILAFPLEDEDGKAVLTELHYEPRLRTEAINLQMKGVKADDFSGMIMAHIVALTGKSKGLLGKLDTVDRNVARAIAIFFM